MKQRCRFVKTDRGTHFHCLRPIARVSASDEDCNWGVGIGSADRAAEIDTGTVRKPAPEQVQAKHARSYEGNAVLEIIGECELDFGIENRDGLARLAGVPIVIDAKYTVLIIVHTHSPFAGG